MMSHTMNGENGDREFMALLFEQYKRLIFRTAYDITHDVWLSDDIVQDVILSLSQKISLLRSRDQARRVNYIISTTKHITLNTIRTRKGITIFSIDAREDEPLFHDPIADMMTLQEFQEDLSCLHRIWPKLDPRSRQLLTARYILCKSSPEIEKELNLSPNALRVALMRARNKAKELMLEEMKK